MSQSLTVLFRRDSSCDRQDDRVQFEGYKLFWPDGRPVAVGLDAFCKHGQRLLGLGKHLAGCREKLIHMLCLPVASADQAMHRMPGHRVRRFFLKREGKVGRIHFMDGTPTTITFELGRDEFRVLHWIGLTELAEGARRWFDLAATAIEMPKAPAAPVLHGRFAACEV